MAPFADPPRTTTCPPMRESSGDGPTVPNYGGQGTGRPTWRGVLTARLVFWVFFFEGLQEVGDGVEGVAFELVAYVEVGVCTATRCVPGSSFLVPGSGFALGAGIRQDVIEEGCAWTGGRWDRFL